MLIPSVCSYWLPIIVAFFLPLHFMDDAVIAPESEEFSGILKVFEFCLINSSSS